MEGPAKRIDSKVDVKSQTFQDRRQAMKALIEEIKADEVRIAQGGGPRAIARQHEKGRLTARERIGILIDPGSDFLEL